MKPGYKKTMCGHCDKPVTVKLTGNEWKIINHRGCFGNKQTVVVEQ